jgi:hypothetical protein
LAAGLTCISVGDWVKQHELHSGYDEDHGSTDHRPRQGAMKEFLGVGAAASVLVYNFGMLVLPGVPSTLGAGMVGDWKLRHELHSGYNEEHAALLIDEDKRRPV